MTELCEGAILQHLSNSPDTVILDTFDFASTQSLDHNTVVGAVKSLLVEAYVTSEELSTSYYVLSSEALEILQHGSQEIRVLRALGAATEGGLTIDQLVALLGKDVAKIGMANCMKLQWVRKKEDNPSILVPVMALNLDEEDVDITRRHLSILQAGKTAELDESALSLLKKRKLITLHTRKSYRVHRGPNYEPIRRKRYADLTKEMLESSSWQHTLFKPYNFLTLGDKILQGGNLHPLLKVRAEFRKILMQMGFEEMPTNQWVESSFWNFDSLFQPQSHPARDAHDTFFIAHPATTHSVPEDYYEKVKTMHEIGGFGSIGYRYDFKQEEAYKNLLRTHTTAVSSRMLYQLANQEGGFKPKKYFSIDRVFRNETMDATHLCEFHQVEGLVADYNLSLGDLIGTIQTFFQKIGITELRFKPAFNPYTEPSMEVFGYHPDLKKWTEIGNSGMFRPEMLRPMGLPENVRVIAWGLSLERPTMIKYRIKNIRDLFGHKVEMARTRTAPVCRFDASM